MTHINLKVTIIFCGLLFLVPGFYLNGQNMSFKKTAVKWPDELPARLSTESQFINEDVIIVDEEVNMIILEDKARLYLGSYGVNHVFTHKYMRMRFNTKAGINNHNELVLPESLYPQADYNYTSKVGRDTIHRPKGDYDCMEYFSARIIKPDGTIIPAIYIDYVSTEKILINQIARSYYAFHFKISNLEPGDDLEVKYGTRYVYAPRHFFFHGILPKQQVKYTLEYNADRYKYYIIEHNGAKADKEIGVRKNYSEKNTWQFQNLKGSMSESQSRPYLELPYVSFYKHELDYGIWNDGQTVIQSYLPYDWNFVNIFYVSYRPPNMENSLSRGDKTTIAIRDFVTNATSGIKDTSVVSKMTTLHNHISNDFNYQKDDDYYAALDTRLPRINEFLNKKTIREISRFDIYDKIAQRLNVDYYRSFLHDKRVNKISYDVFESPVGLNMYYCYLKGNEVNYYFPKYHRFGHFANELPFYHEDVEAILIPQLLPYSESYSNVKNIRYPRVRTPYSTIIDNSRNTNVLTSLSLDSLKASFTATVKLSGQFSTMHRGTYVHNFVDSTVSLQYFDKVSDRVSDGNTTRIKILSVDSIYPFKSDVEIQYSSVKLIKKATGNRYEINMSDWFKHITDPSLKSESRTLSWYPDFVYQDRYRYFLKFDCEVNLAEVPEPIEVQSEHVVYKFGVTQVQPDVIMVESAVVMKSDVMPAKEVNDIEKIFQQIFRVNKSVLVVEKSK